MKKTSRVGCWGSALLLAACDGGGSGGTSSPPDVEQTPTPTPPPGPKTKAVVGRVVDSEGKPVAGIQVLILGLRPVTTDATGRFDISGVALPYDVALLTGGTRSAVVYQGNTREDITLTLPAAEVPPRASATVKGPLVGVQPSSPTVGPPQVVFKAEAGEGGLSTYDASTSTYSLDVSWREAPTTLGTLYVLQGERDSSGNYTRYLGFGQRDNVRLRDATTVSNQGVELSRVTTSTLEGTLTAPSGFTLERRQVELVFSSGAPRLPLITDTRPGASFSDAVPGVGSFRLTAVASSPDRTAVSTSILGGSTARDASVKLVLKAPPRPTLPVDKATGVTTASVFSWRAMPEALHFVTITQEDTGTQPPYTVTVITLANAFTMPDLSALGMTLPADASFTWRVNGRGPITLPMDLLLQYGYLTGNGLRTYTADDATSSPQAFTTARAP